MGTRSLPHARLGSGSAQGPLRSHWSRMGAARPVGSCVAASPCTHSSKALASTATYGRYAAATRACAYRAAMIFARHPVAVPSAGPGRRITRRCRGLRAIVSGAPRAPYGRRDRTTIRRAPQLRSRWQHRAIREVPGRSCTNLCTGLRAKHRENRLNSRARRALRQNGSYHSVARHF